MISFFRDPNFFEPSFSHLKNNGQALFMVASHNEGTMRVSFKYKLAKVLLSRRLREAFMRDFFRPMSGRVGRVGVDTPPIGIIVFFRDRKDSFVTNYHGNMPTLSICLILYLLIYLP